jgi:hypothetical protein
MEEESKNIELTGEQKTRLLSLGLESEPNEDGTDIDEKKADLLYEVLSHPMPVDNSIVSSLPVALRGLCKRLSSVAGEPLGDLLQNPERGISVIKEIKEYAKQSGASAKSEIESDIFLVIYYDTIANALLFHNQKITQHSYKDLEQFFCSFTKKDWILNDLTELFRKAREYCQEKLGEVNNSNK